jgi:dihydrodipicolinate synthase/N-acetylneuraminate lyase
MPMRPGMSGLGGKVQYSPELIERITSIENMVGMKEESEDKGLEYQYNKKFGDNFLVIGCAGMRAFLLDYQWGQKAYMVAIGHFAPEIDLEFYSALTSGDVSKARRIVYDKEGPFFDAAVNMGWQIALKEAMECAGLMEAWGRKPMKRLEVKFRDEISHLLNKTIFKAN